LNSYGTAYTCILIHIPMYCIQTLGLRAANGQNSSILAEDIKKAYRKMAIKYHPDKQVS
jgi:hypothetical protein